MLGKSQILGGLVTAITVAAAFAAFALPASAGAGACVPPPGADGWYCAALARSSADATAGVTDRLVDDSFRDATPTAAPTSEGFVDDSWRSPFVADTVPSGPGFAWDDFGIGVAAALGAMLLAVGLAGRVTGHRRMGVGSA